MNDMLSGPILLRPTTDRWASDKRLCVQIDRMSSLAWPTECSLGPSTKQKHSRPTDSQATGNAGWDVLSGCCLKYRKPQL